MSTDYQSRSAIEPSVAVHLLVLPNELLDIVALYLCGSKSIHNLSRVNKRLRCVAQYAMLRKLCIPPDGLSKASEKLGADPDAALKVYHLDLSKCRYSPSDEQDQAQLVALLPSITELTIWLSPHSDAFRARPLIRSSYHQHDSVIPQILAHKALTERVKVLTVRSDSKFRQSTANTIRLPGFRNLRSLTISMAHLGKPKTISFCRPDGSLLEPRQGSALYPCLPLSLTSLHLTSCTRQTFALLYVFDNIDSEELHLRRITLSFDMSTVSAVILCLSTHTKFEPSERKASRWLRRLKSLTHKLHFVNFLTSDLSMPFIKELEATTRISDSEIALVAGQGLRLSECMAHNREGPRKRSFAERKLFLLHGFSYRQLFCSPTFNYACWLEVAFFHGVKSTSQTLATFRYLLPRG